MDDMTYVIDELKKLMAIDSPTGFTREVAEFLIGELKALGYEPKMTVKGGVLCDLGGVDRENALLLGAHVDTLGGMVAQVKPDGRLRLTNVGGIQPQNIEAENCVVVTRDGRRIEGTFQLINASVHVNKNYATAERNFDTMEVVLDEVTSSKEETEALGVEVGCFVCFDPKTVVTQSGYIKSRFLDDKLSAAILLGYARYLKEEKITPPRRIYLHFTVYEEVGHGGGASIPDGVTEMIAVDMGCVGEGLACTEREVSICVKDGPGPSNYDVVNRMIALCKEHGLGYAPDVYPYYGSDADVAVGNYDIRHIVIGAGVYASHGYERSHVDGVRNTLELLKYYTA